MQVVAKLQDQLSSSQRSNSRLSQSTTSEAVSGLRSELTDMADTVVAMEQHQTHLWTEHEYTVCKLQTQVQELQRELEAERNEGVRLFPN